MKTLLLQKINDIWQFMLNRLVYFVPVVLILTIIESLVYYGITRNIFHLDIKLVMIGFLSLFLFANKQTKEWQILFIINKLIFLPATMFLFLALNYAEMRNYTGYVFGAYHLHPQNLLLTMIFSIGIYSLSRYQITHKDLKNNVPTAIIVLAISYALISTSINSVWIIVSNYNYLVRTDLRTYDARMAAVWGDFYRYITFVRDNTDPNSVIAHPPQANPWQMEGNQLVSRYFLYPRQLNSTMDGAFYPSINKSDWLMITNGTPRFYPADFEGYPSEPIALSEIKLLNKSDVWVEPISLTVHKQNKDETINLKNIEKIQIKSDTIEESSISLLESVDPLVQEIKVKIKSNIQYSASLYQLSKSQPASRIEGPSNIVSDDNLETYTLTYKPAIQGSLYLKITNAQPLPYLYTQAIGRIMHNFPTPKVTIDSHYYEGIGNFYYSNGNWDEAKIAYNQALSLKPDSTESLLGLYYLAKNSGQLDSAVEYAIQLESMLPSDSKFNLGTNLLSTMKENK